MLFVVPGERHVERLAPARAETRAALRARLTAALLPDVRFADERETRLVLAIALEDARASALQLGLFGDAPPDPLLATLRGRGGASWVRTVSAIDEAIGALRARGATEGHLDRVRAGSVATARARTLAAAMRSLDVALGDARDARGLGFELARAIRSAGASRMAELVGTRQVRARWLHAWEPADLAWWRALDETLGEARIALPMFDKRLEGARERDPLEILADAVTRQLEAPPVLETVPAVLGDLASIPPRPESAVVVRAAHAREQARAVARLVREALEGGAAVERVVVAYPVRDERTLVPLRRALDAEGVVFSDALGPPPSSVPVIAAALSALAAAESKDRLAVARLLRSGYVDAPRVFSDVAPREAEALQARLARALETRATQAGADAAQRLLATAGPEAAPLVALFESPPEATRPERARLARRLFRALGFAERAGRGGLATFARDEAPVGVDRAERSAIARDVRAWDLLESSLDTYERLGRGAATEEVFRLELTDWLDASPPLPGAGRAGAVRLLRLADVAGEALDALFVLDANEGVLPRDTRPITLVSEALEGAVVRAGKLGVREAGELGARDLAALAVAAAEAKRVVFVTTSEDGTDAPASPARFVRGLERLAVPEGAGITDATDVERRVRRERAREGFFLDPSRPLSPVVAALEAGPPVLTHATGPSAERPLAVTSVERFAQCAFKGYAHVVLGAREVEEQHELPDAREEGNIGHAALATAFVAARDEWTKHPRDREAILALGLAAADAALDASAGHAPLRAIVRLRVRESVRALLLRAADEEAWTFATAEQRFGQRTPGEWPAFSVAGTDLWLRGSIDRVDRGEGRVRVVDYKRSKNTVRSSTAGLGETALQVPIYAVVAARQLRAEATGLYLPMQPRDLAQLPRPKDDKVADLARGEPSEIERRLADVVRRVRLGQLAPLPVRESECTYCSVSGGCRKPRFAMAPDEDAEDA